MDQAVCWPGYLLRSEGDGARWPVAEGCAIKVEPLNLRKLCRLSIFPRGKSTASSSTTVPALAERPPTCSGSTSTRDRIKRENGFAGDGNRSHAFLRFSSARSRHGARIQNSLSSIYGSRPGFYEASRRLILKGADGVVFVADSQEERLDANLETLDNLREHLRDHNIDFETIPYVLQLNKRDLPNIFPVDELRKQLMVKDEPVLEGVRSPDRESSIR